jgi:hypothetical protein
MSNEETDWARESFGAARLGDPRRVARLVAMAEQAATTPAGRVTEVFKSSATREGAFRLLESTAVPSERVAEALFEATGRRIEGGELVYVAIDGSSLTLSDRSKRRELGRVGKRWPTRGLHVMTALALDNGGTAMGVLDQQWWAQPETPKRDRRKCFGTKYLEKETRHWLETIGAAEQRLKGHAPDAHAWFQLDRGADCWPVLQLAVQEKLLLTVRSCHDRRLEDQQGRRIYLRETLRRQPVLGHYEIDMPERPGRPARIARVSLRSCRVVVSARVGSKTRRSIVLNAVMAEEVTRRTKDKLCWVLLTTASVSDFGEARAVVRGYTLRWRIEEFHRAWKRGLCRVEDTQLQSRGAIIKWASILAGVAARALRVAQLLRTKPDVPASQEFTEYEIAATFALAKKKLDRRRKLSFKEVAAMIADIGGFANKYSGHPGPTVIGRGLERVTIIALALKNMDDLR